jgi:hypothetical protein
LYTSCIPRARAPYAFNNISNNTIFVFSNLYEKEFLKSAKAAAAYLHGVYKLNETVDHQFILNTHSAINNWIGF